MVSTVMSETRLSVSESLSISSAPRPRHPPPPADAWYFRAVRAAVDETVSNISALEYELSSLALTPSTCATLSPAQLTSTEAPQWEEFKEEEEEDDCPLPVKTFHMIGYLIAVQMCQGRESDWLDCLKEPVEGGWEYWANVVCHKPRYRYRKRCIALRQGPSDQYWPELLRLVEDLRAGR